jgi:hypothetical protein
MIDESEIAAWRGQPSKEEKVRERHIAALRQRLASSYADELIAKLDSLYPASFIAAFHQVKARAEAALVTDTPFPHIVIDDPYTDAYFALLRDGIPDRAFFDPLQETKYDIDLTSSYGIYRLLPPSRRAPWDFMLDVIVRLALVPALTRKFAAHLQEKYGGLVGATEPFEYLTGAEREDADIGTDLYTGPAFDITLDASTTYAQKMGVEVQPAGVVPFKPNRLLCFPNLPYAHHGTNVPSDRRYDAGRVVYQFHIAPFEDALQAARAKSGK